MTDAHPTPAWGTTLAWAHALLFLALAAACYLAPQAVFGDAAWQPLARLAMGLLAATLAALGVVLIGAVRSGLPRTLRLALLAALVVDVQAPVLLSLHPAALEYLERDVGVPWFSASLACIVLVAVTVMGVSSLRAQQGVDAV